MERRSPRKHLTRSATNGQWEGDGDNDGKLRNRPLRADECEVARKTGAWPYRAVGSLAEVQHALVTRGQLFALGIGSGAIDYALECGRLHPMHRGVYSLVPSAALPPLAREHAAVLAVGDGSFLSHHAAAGVWGLRPPAEGDLDVTLLAGDCRRPGIRIHRVKRLQAQDARIRDRIPITSPARTLLDIAAELADRELERAFDEGLARRLTTVAAIRELLQRYRGASGSARLRALADPARKSTMTRSQAEELFLALVRKAPIPDPEVNVMLGPFEVDFLWRSERVVVEIDGYAFHRGRLAFERDHRRDAELHDAGFHVIRVTWKQLTSEPEAVLVRLARALTRRGAGS
jgi:very-short-patch-repair endonuclease